MEQRVAERALDYEHSWYVPPYAQLGFSERMDMVVRLVNDNRAVGESLVDLGCNGGHLLERVAAPRWGYDIAIGPLGVARENGHDARSADITKDELELAPIVTICEVLEHLDDPHALVRRLNDDPVRLVIASGPYLETAESHYEQHVWTWDVEGFAAMFTEAGFDVLGSATVGIFQSLVAER